MNIIKLINKYDKILNEKNNDIKYHMINDYIKKLENKYYIKDPFFKLKNSNNNFFISNKYIN